MTAQQAIEQWQAGAMILLVEYRHSTAEVINWRDKATGKVESMNSLTHNIEAGKLSIAVRERVQGQLNVEQYKPPFQTGQKCILRVESLVREKGVWKASGALEPILNGK